MGLFPKDRNLAVVPDRVELDVRASDFRLPIEGFSIRLDAFLTHHLHWRSRSSVQQLIRDGFVRVGASRPESPSATEPGEERRASTKLRHGSRVVVIIPEELRLQQVRTEPEGLRVLYEDDEVLAVDKPPFLPVHPSGRHLTDTLIQRVHARYQAPEEGAGRLPIRLCHRLDRETSGVVLIAKDPRAHRRVMRQFERRQTEKEYLAIVHGRPNEDRGVVDMPLGPARDSEVHLKITVVPDGLPSTTRWRVVERYADCSLLACQPVTGRQHQIRVHLAALGFPLVGDKLYGQDEGLFLRANSGVLTEADRRVLGLERHALHNHRLAWTSPASGERREATSPLAADLEEFLRGRQLS